MTSSGEPFVMKRVAQLTVRLLIVILTFGLFIPQVFAGTVNDDKEVIRKARLAYYNLRTLGLVGFRANLQPNWELAVKNITTDPARLKMLNGLHFSMSLDEQGAVKVNHSSDAGPPTEEMQNSFNQIYEGMDEMVSGFFATWRLFILESPFPAPESDYQLKDLGNQYVLTYKEGSAAVSTTLTKEFAISELKVSTPAFNSLIKPQFLKTPKGYLVTGYEATYDPTTGPGKVKLNLQMDYQEVRGLNLPRKVHMSGLYDANPVEAELLFSEYVVNAR